MDSAATVLEVENDALRAQVVAFDALIKARDERIRQLEELIRTMRSRQFGASSEQTPPGQGRLFDEPEAEGPAADDTSVPVKAHARQASRRPRLPAELPRVEIVHDLAAHEQVCPEHGCALKPMGEEISERLRFIPATVEVERHICRKYTCPHCDGRIITAAKPAQLIPRSISTPSLLSWVTVSKYADALPLYRQSAIFARLGIELDRTTLARWMVQCGEAVQPLINLLWERLRQSALVHLDETRVQVLAEPGRPPQADSYMWVAAAGAPSASIVLFHYDPSRSGDVARALLESWRGALMVDGYSGYDDVGNEPGRIRLGCWAHARRKFIEAQRLQPKGKTGKPDQALGFINALYRIERLATQAGLDPAQRLAVRREKAMPILAALRAWLTATLPATAPGTALGKALTYLHNQWDRLSRYVEDSGHPIDNNRAENAIRPFVVGRKNWIFSQSVAGVRASANLYSLIETAKGHGLDPHQYLIRVYTELPKATCLDDIEALLPERIKYGG